MMRFRIPVLLFLVTSASVAYGSDATTVAVTARIIAPPIHVKLAPRIDSGANAPATTAVGSRLTQTDAVVVVEKPHPVNPPGGANVNATVVLITLHNR